MNKPALNYGVASTTNQNPELKTITQYVDEFCALRQQTSDSIILMSCLVCTAKSTLSDLQFEQFCKAVGYGSKSSSIRKFLQIGKQADLLLRFKERVPDSWTSVYQLAQLDPVILECALDDGTITQDTTGVSIRKFVAEHNPRQPSNSQRIKKFYYKYGGTLNQPIDEAVQRELDRLIADFFADKVMTEKENDDQMNGAK